MSNSRKTPASAVDSRSFSSSGLVRFGRVALGLVLATICLSEAKAQNLPGWTLVWSDEFDQPTGSSPNSVKWAYDTGAGGWGNQERQNYTSRTNNARIENGMLVIEAKQENYGGANYTSARLKTQGKAAWTYGRFEARIKIPRGQGIWPAFWMLGTNITSVNWPNCGEIDILENIGREPTIVHGTVHGPGYSGGNGIGGDYSLPGNPAFADNFHVYAVEWSTNQIKWFVNGVQFFTLTPASLPNGAPWVFTAPQFLILNVAVGGNWPGDPDGTTVFPQRMTVDYVRVYTASNAPPTSSGALLNGNFETGVLAPWIGKDFCCANPSGGNIAGTNGLVWDPTINANNTQNIRNPAFGAYSAKVYGNFNGNPNSPGFYQDVVALPDSVWTATIKARTQNTDHIRDSNQAVAEVSFLSATDALLAKYSSQIFNTSTPANTWVDLNVTHRTYPSLATTNQMRAPPGTVKLRFAVTFSQTLYDWGSIYFDEAQLVEIVPPVLIAPTLTATANESGQIEISFATQAGANYEVRYKNAWSDATWQVLETVVGDGSPKSVSYPVSEPARFYGVRVY
jgi:beta-glucanase (GH16 family)